MPEFPGYTGPASDQCWMIKVTAVTHRKNPIMQTCIGPSEEHVSMAWSKKQCQADFKMFIVHQQVEENTWQCFNSKNQ